MQFKEDERKFIPVRDFIYLCVILVIILITVISFFLGDSAKAGENLNFGATAISIVLAVIAIIMTIVDSAGQKQNVYDLKKSLEVMQVTLVEEKLVVEQFKEQLGVVEQSRIELMEEIKNIVSFRDEIMKITNKKSEDGKESNDKRIEEIQEKVNDFNLVSPSIGRTMHYVISVEVEIQDEVVKKKAVSDFINYLRSSGFRPYRWTVPKSSSPLKVYIRTFLGSEMELINSIKNYQDPSFNFIGID